MNNQRLVEKVRNGAFAAEFQDALGERVLDALSKTDRAHFIPDNSFLGYLFDPNRIQVTKDNLESFFQHTDIRIADDSEKIVMYDKMDALADSVMYLIGTKLLVELTLKAFAYDDRALATICNQTTSQPSVVAMMCKQLEIDPGMKILEIGTGAGYHAAVILDLIGRSGRLITVETIKDIKEYAEERIQSYLADLDGSCRFVIGDGSLGVQEESPFDRIYFTAAVNQDTFKPEILSSQLKPELGILMYPVIHGLLIKRVYKENQLMDEIKFNNINFMSLVGQNS